MFDKIFKSKKDNEFRVVFFVASSLVAFFSMGIFILILGINNFYENYRPNRLYFDPNATYKVKENVVGDPYILDVPQLNDVLGGPIIQNTDPSLGNDDASVFVVYFSDFECKYCQKQETVVKNVVNKYDGKVKLIWKDYPESNINSSSWKAAVAGRCAQEQGKFWTYHDLLYEKSDNLNDEVFLDLAEDADLRINVFKECMNDPEMHNMVRNNILEAKALEVNGIPFIYINDRGFLGEMTEIELERLIDMELADK